MCVCSMAIPARRRLSFVVPSLAPAGLPVASHAAQRVQDGVFSGADELGEGRRVGSLSVAGGAKKACVFSLCQKKKWHHNSNFRLLPSFVPSPTFAPRTKKTKKQKMDAALDKVAAAVDKAEPAVEKAVRSALGDKAGDAVHKAAETVKDALKDDVRELFFFFATKVVSAGNEKKQTFLTPLSLSIPPPFLHSNPHVNNNRPSAPRSRRSPARRRPSSRASSERRRSRRIEYQ